MYTCRILHIDIYLILCMLVHSAHAQVRDRTLSLYLFSYVLWVFMRWSVGYPVLTGETQVTFNGFQRFSNGFCGAVIEELGREGD